MDVDDSILKKPKPSSDVYAVETNLESDSSEIFDILPIHTRIFMMKNKKQQLESTVFPKSVGVPKAKVTREIDNIQTENSTSNRCIDTCIPLVTSDKANCCNNIVDYTDSEVDIIDDSDADPDYMPSPDRVDLTDCSDSDQ